MKITRFLTLALAFTLLASTAWAIPVNILYLNSTRGTGRV
jgi:hypothetical protein